MVWILFLIIVYYSSKYVTFGFTSVFLTKSDLIIPISPSAVYILVSKA